MIGLRELLIIGVVALVLYGRSGALKSRRARTILPWLSPMRRPVGGKSPGGTGARPSPAASRPSAATAARPERSIPGASLVRGGRLVWILTFLAATAMAAWIITRTLITSGAATGLKP
ncbi:MAG: hypothetical protein ACLP7Q_26710 [Isosphaeraceae bacterium]